jgi:MOB kinase activator 1
MGIGGRTNNSSRSPSRPPAPPSSTGSAPAQPQHQHQHQHYQHQQQQQQQQPPAGQGYSNAPLPRSGNGNGQQPTKGQQQTERLYLCLPFVKAALVKGNFKTIVALPKCMSARLPLRPSEGTAWLIADGRPFPPDVDVNEWVAVNREYTLLALVRTDMRIMRALADSFARLAVKVVDLFNNLNLYYSVVTEFCTVESNPTMSAGPG